MDLRWVDECAWAEKWQLEIAAERFPFFVRTKKRYGQLDLDSGIVDWMEQRKLVLAENLKDNGDFIYWETNAFIFADMQEAVLFKLRFG